MHILTMTKSKSKLNLQGKPSLVEDNEIMHALLRAPHLKKISLIA